MIHRSLQMGSDIFIHLYPDMVEISNPGGFPYGVNLGNSLFKTFVINRNLNRLRTKSIESLVT